MNKQASDQLLFQRKVVRKNETADFTLTAYNILADCHIPTTNNRKNDTDIYTYCDEGYLRKDCNRKSPRHLLFMEEIRYLASDVFCLQEIDVEYFPILQAELQSLGYESHFEPKVLGTKEGVMTSYKHEIFQLISKHRIVLNDLMYDRISSMHSKYNRQSIELFERDSVAVVLHMQHLPSMKEVILCNYHAIYDIANPDIATLQVCLLSHKLKHLRDLYLDKMSSCADIPIIFCGDFNVEPDKYTYKVMVNGTLSPEEIEHHGKICYVINPDTKTTEEKIRPNYHNSAACVFKDVLSVPLTFTIAYKDILGTEPEITSSDGVHAGTLDYIFHTPEITTVGVLSPFSKDDLLPGGPSRTFPSDHISLKAEFKFLK